MEILSHKMRVDIDKQYTTSEGNHDVSFNLKYRGMIVMLNRLVLGLLALKNYFLFSIPIFTNNYKNPVFTISYTNI